MAISWTEVLLGLAETTPYVLFVLLAYAGAYFMYRETIKAIKDYSGKTLEEMRKTYDDALRILNDD